MTTDHWPHRQEAQRVVILQHKSHIAFTTLSQIYTIYCLYIYISLAHSARVGSRIAPFNGKRSTAIRKYSKYSPNDVEIIVYFDFAPFCRLNLCQKIGGKKTKNHAFVVLRDSFVYVQFKCERRISAVHDPRSTDRRAREKIFIHFIQLSITSGVRIRFRRSFPTHTCHKHLAPSHSTTNHTRAQHNTETGASS